MAIDPPANETFAFSRLIDAPRDLVWAAFTDPKHLAHWWGPAGMKISRCEVDLRPGGLHLYAMEAPNGAVMWGRWVFREIAAPERMVFVSSFSNEQGEITRAPFAPAFPAEVLSTLTFEAQGDKTLVSLVGVPINANEAERAMFAAFNISMQGGWGATFAQLDAYLAGMRPA